MTQLRQHKKLISQKARDNELKELISHRVFFQAASSNPRIQSKIIDSLVFPNKQEIEKKLVRDYDDLRDVDYREEESFDCSQPWIGIDPQTLETTYWDFAQLFEFLDQENFNLKEVVDIGSAYGRAGVVASSIFPQVTFTGYEIVEERVVESKSAFERLGLTNCNALLKNVLHEEIKDADLYIIYDFSHADDIEQLIKKLLEENGDVPFLIAAIGGNTPEIIFKMFSDLEPVAVPPERRGWYLFQNQPNLNPT